MKMVKIEISDTAAAQLSNILNDVEEDIRSRRNPPKGMSAAGVWDQLDAIKELNAALRLNQPTVTA